MPDIKVTKVEVKHSEKYGDRKVLYVDDGSKWNVSEKKPFYDSVSGPGTYYAEFKDYEGKQYISYLKFKEALNGQNQPVNAVSAAQGTSGTGNAYETNLKLRLAADKKRQDDIRLEFYCGIAKDILLANKQEGAMVDYREVIPIGLDLYKKHIDVLEMLQEQDIGKEQAKVSSTGSTYGKAQAALEADANEDVPF